MFINQQRVQLLSVESIDSPGQKTLLEAGTTKGYRDSGGLSAVHYLLSDMLVKRQSMRLEIPCPDWYPLSR